MPYQGGVPAIFLCAELLPLRGAAEECPAPVHYSEVQCSVTKY
jgi:hypothetical protein